MAITYKDIGLLTQKATITGTEKIPVSDTQYLTPNQIAGLAKSRYIELQGMWSEYDEDNDFSWHGTYAQAKSRFGITDDDITAFIAGEVFGISLPDTGFIQLYEREVYSKDEADQNNVYYKFYLPLSNGLSAGYDPTALYIKLLLTGTDNYSFQLEWKTATTPWPVEISRSSGYADVWKGLRDWNNDTYAFPDTADGTEDHTLATTDLIPASLADLATDSTHRLVTDTEKSTWNGKQDALVSGTNIKTINSTSLLGSGNISVGTYSKPSGGIPASDIASGVIPTNTSDLTNDSNFRSITISSSEPTSSQGSNGDIWIVI